MSATQQETKGSPSLAARFARAAIIGALTVAILVACGFWEAWRVAVAVGLVCVALWGATRISHRRRRLLVGALRRKLRWEFWPPRVWYPPIVLYMLWLGLKRRFRFFLFTAVNPAIPAGGLVGESKIEILGGLKDSPELVAKAILVDPADGVEACLDRVHKFLSENGLEYPVVLKPNSGYRGKDVAIARSDDEARACLGATGEPTIVQEYAPGKEFGVFYYRYPNESKGRIFSVCEKRLAEVEGDGERTLEQLILDGPRAVCMARVYFQTNADRLDTVPAAGERVQLGEIGNHARGCIFLDGNWVTTPELTEAIDRISQRYEGFYFGRYDIMTPCVEDFQQGRNFKIIELNGVSSEATDCYDPKHSLLAAYRILFPQWRIAYEIAAQNVANGARAWKLRDVWRLLRDYRRQQRAWQQTARSNIHAPSPRR